jgi:hypothetical protein
MDRIARLFRKNPHFQYVAYGFVVGIILIVLLLVVFDRPSFVSYKTTSCYNRQPVELTQDVDIQEVEPLSVQWSLEEEEAHLLYSFQQKCYSGLDVTHTVEGNQVRVIVFPQKLQDDCMCQTDLEVTLKPVEREYTIDLVKRTDSGQYTVDSRTIP